MIRNLLYSLSLHLILALVIYLNFNFQDYIEIDSKKPITVSFVALKDEVIIPQRKQEDIKSIAKKIQTKVSKPKKKPKRPEPSPKPKKKKKQKKSEIKKFKKDDKKTEDGKKKVSKKRAIQVKQDNNNVEKIQTINLSVRERINVEMQIKRCYKNAIRETSAISNIPIKINVKIKPDGTINTPSMKILNKEEFQGLKSDLEIAVLNAKTALQLCSPIRNLPPDKYEIWQEMELVFDSRN